MVGPTAAAGQVAVTALFPRRGRLLAAPFSRRGRLLAALFPRRRGGLVALAAVAASCALVSACGTATSGSSGAASAPTAAPTTGSKAIPAAECAANRAAGTVTFISPFGFDASAGIIDVYVAEKLGYFAQMCIHVSLDASAEDGVELVSSGRAQVTGEGSAADALAADAHGADLVSVATFAAFSDYTLITNKRFTSLKQLQGKTLGYYTALPVAIQAMLAKEGVDLSKVKLVSMTDYDPTQVARGVVDALQGYQSDQVLTLEADHVPFNQFSPTSYGVKGTYNTVEFNGAFLAAHRQTVADWLRADLRAANYCLTHVAACVDIEHQYAVAAHAAAAYPLSHEMRVWSLEAGLIDKYRLPGLGLGVQTYAEWRPELQQLVRFHVVRTAPSLQKYEDVALVAGLYKGTTLIWP